MFKGRGGLKGQVKSWRDLVRGNRLIVQNGEAGLFIGAAVPPGCARCANSLKKEELWHTTLKKILYLIQLYSRPFPSPFSPPVHKSKTFWHLPQETSGNPLHAPAWMTHAFTLSLLQSTIESSFDFVKSKSNWTLSLLRHLTGEIPFIFTGLYGNSNGARNSRKPRPFKSLALSTYFFQHIAINLIVFRVEEESSRFTRIDPRFCVFYRFFFVSFFGLDLCDPHWNDLQLGHLTTVFVINNFEKKK